MAKTGEGERERRGSAQLDHYPRKPGYRLAEALNITTVLERRSPGPWLVGPAPQSWQ